MKTTEKLRKLEETEKGNETVTTVMSSDEEEIESTTNGAKRNTYKSKQYTDYQLSFSSSDEEEKLPPIPKSNIHSNQIISLNIFEKPKQKTGAIPKRNIEHTFQKKQDSESNSENLHGPLIGTENLTPPPLPQRETEKLPEEVSTFIGLGKKVASIEGKRYFFQG